MDPKRIELKTLIIGAGGAVALEAAAAQLAPHLPVSRLVLLALVRMLQITLLAAVAFNFDPTLTRFGLDKKRLEPGLKQGLIWSAAFGVIAAIAFGAAHLLGRPLWSFFQFPLPSSPMNRALFIIVGGLLSPAAEEFLFRGFIFGYCRRWGFAAALIGSLALFVLAHGPVGGPPIVQIAGGAVFAAAYEKSKSLITPLTIHILGNLSLFMLA